MLRSTHAAIYLCTQCYCYGRNKRVINAPLSLCCRHFITFIISRTRSLLSLSLLLPPLAVWFYEMMPTKKTFFLLFFTISKHQQFSFAPTIASFLQILLCHVNIVWKALAYNWCLSAQYKALIIPSFSHTRFFYC
jgi:hypothetical protein